MKILVVEDEYCLNICKRINFRCYVVDCVYDVEQTLYEYQGNEYDLIVLDLNLPIADGLDVLK